MAGSIGARQREARARSRGPGTCGRRICRPTSIPRGLEVTAGYKPERDTGTFSYGAHAAMVAVDPGDRRVEILDYIIVEDGGKLVNPMVVDGQIYGGVAQGIGTALLRRDAVRCARASRSPRPCGLSAARRDRSAKHPVVHMETPSPHTGFGQKGIGEGGAIAPPAAIANAVNDALAAARRRIAGVADHAARILEAIAKAERLPDAQGGSPEKHA